MKIGIDFISSVKIVDGIASYTGGTNYVKAVLKNLLLSNKKNKADWILYLPEGFITPEEDKSIFDNEIFQKRFAKSIEDCDYNDINVLFLPQVNGKLLMAIPAIKKKNSHIKVYATLHDRQHNFYKYDWIDRFYYKGIKATGIPGFFEYYVKKLAFDVLYSRTVTYIDKIFTVSNHSMQKLMNRKVKKIKYFVQESIVQCNENECGKCGDYILFVGAGRPEKNLLRTMLAFKRYKEKSKKEYKLVVTGVSDGLRKKLTGAMREEYASIRDCIEFMPYLPYDELRKLYLNCRYVIFTSKGEGYGLPVREALSYGKTVLASRTTSVPEVAGSALYYVDPFDISSIASGFEKFDSDAVLAKYENYARDRSKVIEKMAKLDMEILIDELLE